MASIDNKVIRVLIVDDDKLLSETLGLLIENVMETKFDIVHAYDGKSALQKIEDENFDLLFFDYLLPDIDGLSMLRELKKREIIKPVILLTGYSNEDIVSQAKKLGALDIISKGDMNIETIIRVINKALTL